MTMIEALIFDFDGTLVDTETPEFDAWQRVFREHGVELDLNDWVRGVGAIGAFSPVDHLAEKLGDDVDRDRAKARARDYCMSIIDTLAPRDGVMELLDGAVSRGLRLAVASSSTHNWVDAQLRRVGLTERFAAVICRDDVGGRAKPQPDVYLAALRALEVPAHAAIAFEDSLNGLLAAKAAQLFTVITHHAVTQHLPFAHADVVAASASHVQLETLLRRGD